MSEKMSTSSRSEDHEYSVQMVRWFLKPINVWPLRTNASSFEKILAVFLTVICTFLIIFMVIPCILGMIYEEAENTETRLRDIGPLSFWLVGSVKYVALLLHVDDIRHCVEQMEMDWRAVKRAQDRDVMLTSAKKGRFIAGFSAFFLHSGFVSFNIAMWSKTGVKIVDNDTVIVRYTPYPFHKEIWDIRYSPAYETVCAVQFVSTVVVNMIMTGSCGLAAVLVMHAHGQLKILVSSFDDFVDGDGTLNDTVEDRLTVIVKKHLRVLRFTSTIENIMHLVCLVEILGSTLTMCLLAYCTVTEWSVNQKENILSYCTIFVSISFNLFVHCFIGDILSEQSQLVGEMAYMTEWYRLPGKTAVDVVLIILRSNSVIKITAGKVIQLSVSTYSDVLKTVLTYFNMLRAVTYTTDM